MKITYLLGAGASYNSIPIIEELNAAFLATAQMGKNSLNNISNRPDFVQLNKAFTSFEAHMQTGANAAARFGTIDTYAKHLSLTNPDDLKKLKASLSLFFSVWQDIPAKFKNQHRIRSVEFEDIDHRYLGLLANYLEKDENKIYLNESINFITWNYDSQLERAISLFTNTDLETCIDCFGVYPYNETYKNYTPRVVHLNGVAGFYQEKDKYTKTLFTKNKTQDSYGHIFVDNLTFLNSIEENNYFNDKYFSYAWEDDEISKRAINEASRILNETEILVIIGYSFPTFNNSIDQQLFQSLRASARFSKVYYQDPNASVEIISSRFGISQEKIQVVNQDMKQFVLPLGSSNLNSGKYHFA